MQRWKNRFTFRKREILVAQPPPDLEAKKETLPLSTEPKPKPKSRLFRRLIQFWEHASFQTLLGIVGGLVGTFLDGRYYVLLALLTPFSLHRSGALKGLSVKTKAISTSVVMTVVGVLLLWMGTLLNKARPHVYTPAEYAAAIMNGTPLPVTQQISNVYNSYINPPEPFGEPRIDLKEWDFVNIDADGSHFSTSAVNNGKTKAIDMLTTDHAYLLPKSTASEEAVFRELEAKKFDQDAPRGDLSPGKDYAKIIPLLAAPGIAQDPSLRDGSNVLYMGLVVSYKDERGAVYISELCMYLTPKQASLSYCDGHNKIRKLKS